MQGSDSPDDGPVGTFFNFRAVLQARMAAQQHGLRAPLRHLLEVVAGFTNGHPAFPSYETLAGITGLKADAVRKQVKALIDQGYLARTRRPRPNGGWGQPEWALGPTCSQVEVGSPSHSSGITVPLASGITVPQKRRLPTTVVRPPLVGVLERGVEERKEERGKRAPTGKNSLVIDALRAKGYRPSLTDRDHQAIKRSDLTVEQIAEVYHAVLATSFGDDFMRRGLTVAKAIAHWDGYQAHQHAPAPTNGRVKRGVAALADL